MKIVIVGLGLIGGSFAKAFARAGGHEVRAYDKNREILSRARAQRVIMGEANDGALRAAQLVLLALHPRATVDFILEKAPVFGPRALLLDTCGVKTPVCEAAFRAARAHGFAFIGGHPMAGRECSGYESSLPGLFDGASFILTPPEGQGPPDWLEGLLKSAGFKKLLTTTPERHDEMIAYTSQLPHALACAYILDERAAAHDGFSAGSFRDVSRVAGVDEKLWTQLFLMNAEHLSASIAGLAARLEAVRACLDAADAAGLAALLKKSREMKEKSEGKKS